MMKFKKFLITVQAVLFMAFTFAAVSLAADPVHFTGVKTQPTSCAYAGTVTIDGVAAVDSEDEAGVYVSDGAGGEILVGACVMGQVMPGNYFVNIYGDDATTTVKDGAANNEELVFKVWDKSADREFTISSSSMAAVAETGLTLPAVPPIWTDATTFGLLNLAAVSIPAKFVILDPADGTVDAPVAVTIELQDAEGGVCAGANDTHVTVVVDKGAISESQPITVTNGVATVHIIYHEIGTVNISLNDSESTGYDVTSTQDVAFTHGAATKIDLSANPAQISSSAVSESTLTATIQDQYNNTVTSGYDSTLAVTFAVTDSTYGDIKTGETNPDNAVNGVATIKIESKIDPTGGNIPCTATAKAGALTGTVTVTTVPFGIVPAGPVRLEVNGTQNFCITGGTPPYAWTLTDGGKLSKSITTTASEINVYTAPSSPATVTVTATDSSTPALTSIVNINVYDKVGITNKPTEAPTVAPGEKSDTFTVQGGDGTYVWTVTGPVAVTGGTGNSYTFTAPTIGAFSGVYTVTVTDNAGFADSFEVKVPIKLTPDSKVFTETKLDCSANPQTLTVTGASSDYTWEILDLKTAVAEVATPAGYGTWTSISPVSGDATNIFNPADVDAIKRFHIRVTVENDADLTESNGLNKRVFGPFNLIPVDTFTVTVSGLGGTAIAGANVSVDYTDPNTSIQVAAKNTDAGGQAAFILPDAGGTYSYAVTAAGKVSQETSSASKDVGVILKCIGDTIAGTVQDTMGSAKSGAAVSAYQPSDITARYQATTDGTGAYTINLPVGAPQSGWTVVAGLANFVAVSQTDQAVGTVDFTSASGKGLQAKTTMTSVTAAVVGTTVQLDITAIPAFLSAGEASASRISGSGAPGAPSWTGGTVSIIYDTVEDFTVVIKADTSENNDPATGYFASCAFSYVAADTATKAEQIDVEAGSSGTKTVTANLQTAEVEVLVGGLTKAATIVIKQVPKTKTAISTQASPTYVYEVTATDSTTGSKLTAGDINRIEITLPIDLSVVSPGDLENGVFVIYHADSLAALEAGGGTAVPTANIISTDYIGDGAVGTVTFWVNHLSVFGIGGSSGGGVVGGTSLSDSSSDSQCFIATAAYGSPFESHVKILRNFRDVYLLSTRLGHAFVDTYYKYSPNAAAFIADHDVLRAVVRVGLMPVVGISYAALHTTAAQKMLITLLMVSLLAGGYLAVRRLKVRKTVTA